MYKLCEGIEFEDNSVEMKETVTPAFPTLWDAIESLRDLSCSQHRKLEVVELGLFRHCPEALMAMRQVWNEKGLQFYKLWIIKRSFVVDKA